MAGVSRLDCSGAIGDAAGVGFAAAMERSHLEAMDVELYGAGLRSGVRGQPQPLGEELLHG